jgi:hypothetical protein
MTINRLLESFMEGSVNYLHCPSGETGIKLKMVEALEVKCGHPAELSFAQGGY